MLKEEHEAAKAVLGKLDPDDEDQVLSARHDVLETMINSHVEFEEGELLQTANEVIDEDQQEEITAKFKEAYK